jgi:hypothetical protein
VSTGHDRASDADWRSACQEACAVLRGIPLWYLTPSRWPEVSAAIAELAEAAAAGDAFALWGAAARLDLFDSLRTEIRLGDVPPVLPAPKPVRDRAAELITTLGRAADQKAADQKAGDDPGPGARRARA